MQISNLQAYIIFGTDPHLSEYLPERYQTRSFISGFTGSAGTVIVTAEKAALWTDSRYFLQAEDQLSGSGIELVKLRTPGHPNFVEWLSINLSPGDCAGVDEWCCPVSQFRPMHESLQKSGIVLKTAGDLINKIWSARPELSLSAVYEHELKYACRTRELKIEGIRLEMGKAGADFHFITALDDLAWTFNLRGTDVEFNPVFAAYAAISVAEAVLFVEERKVPDFLKLKLESEGIRILSYSEIATYLCQLPEKSRVLIDPDRCNQAIMSLIPEQCQLIEALSVPCKLKSLKTPDEIRNIRQAMRKDGVALVEFLFWIENNLGKVAINEYQVAEKLTEFRSRQADFKGISFFPIVGYKEHGAIVHFHVTEENALPIHPDGFLLFDSGGHYLDGTTDTTRTIALSALSEAQKRDFTIVLKGMISLTMAKFPVNTRGYHLDILARAAMWKHGLNYGHGTGHGVGYFLNVHEGPMAIRQEFNDCAIEPGMVLSNEPALYRLGEYGLRTENMMVCMEDETTEFGNFLRFDTLTLCPIDTKAIEKSLLAPEEITWLNNYHQWVFEELSPILDERLKSFLKKLTEPI
jgi:Xaa-Pro aminopeptidase